MLYKVSTYGNLSRTVGMMAVNLMPCELQDFRPNELRQLLMLLRKSAIGLTSDPASDEMGYLVA